MEAELKMYKGKTKSGIEWKWDEKTGMRYECNLADLKSEDTMEAWNTLRRLRDVKFK